MKRSALSFTVIYSIFHLPLQAYPSLFFTEEEVNQVRESERLVNPPANSLYLSGILFVNETHWAIWINGKCYHSENHNDIEQIKIEKVTAHVVTVKIVATQQSLLLHLNQLVFF